jgi:hypothetical protein
MRNLSRWEMAVRQLPRLVALLVAAAHAPASGQTPSKTSAADSFYAAACGTGASMGNALACYRLGELYWEGRSVAEDKPRAAKLYQKACERSDLEPRACLRLGELYERGEVAPKVPHRALTLYRMACDAGNQEACSRSTSLQASLGIAAPVAPPPVPQAAPPAPAPTEYDDSEEATEAKIASFNARFEEQKRKATTQEERDRIERSRQSTEKLFRLTAKASRLEREIKAGNEKLKSLTKRANENTEAMKRNSEEQERINKILEKYEPYLNPGSGSSKAP